MNNISCSSHQKSLNVVHAVVSASDLSETIVRTLPEAFETGHSKKNLSANSAATEQEEYLLSTYQPIAHGSILPVHGLLF